MNFSRLERTKYNVTTPTKKKRKNSSTKKKFLTKEERLSEHYTKSGMRPMVCSLLIFIRETVSDSLASRFEDNSDENYLVDSVIDLFLLTTTVLIVEHLIADPYRTSLTSFSPRLVGSILFVVAKNAKETCAYSIFLRCFSY